MVKDEEDNYRTISSLTDFLGGDPDGDRMLNREPEEPDSKKKFYDLTASLDEDLDKKRMLNNLYPEFGKGRLDIIINMDKFGKGRLDIIIDKKNPPGHVIENILGEKPFIFPFKEQREPHNREKDPYFESCVVVEVKYGHYVVIPTSDPCMPKSGTKGCSDLIPPKYSFQPSFQPRFSVVRFRTDTESQSLTERVLEIIYEQRGSSIEDVRTALTDSRVGVCGKIERPPALKYIIDTIREKNLYKP